MTRWAPTWTRVVVALAPLMIATGSLSGQNTGASTISNGLALLARREVAAAMREFRLAARDSNPVTRSAGEQWLGHLSWMVYADAKAAAEHLDHAIIAGRDSSMTLIERARLLGFQRRYGDAARTAVAAMRSAVESERRGLAARVVVETAADGAFAAITAKANIADSVDVPVIHEALDTLRGRTRQFPGRTVDAWAMLEAGVLLGDREAIVEASTSYFLLMHGPTRPPSASPADDLVSLAMSLAKSRLYEPAALLLVQPTNPPTHQLADAAAYGSFIHQLRAATNEFYRRALLGLAKEGDLDRTLNARTRALWPALHWPPGAPPYYPAAVPRELAKRFNTAMGIERGAGIPELHLTQVIETYSVATPADSSRGRGTARVVVLDAIASNGLEHWLLDGAGGRAGWVSGDSIFEVRRAFTETPFLAWIALTDPRIGSGGVFQHDDTTDIARARRDSIAYLPGVAARLFRAGASVVFDSLSRETMSEVQRQAAFVGILFNQLTETTIALHESRHVADARRLKHPITDAVAEFRAKIDEVALASRPKLALTAILHPNIGDATPHGLANRRIMLGLIRWIRAHSAEIIGFDASIPPLVQLPLLTDAQLRAAFQSMRGAS